MLARLLAFACLFVFNCQLYAKSVALGGSRRVQLGRETRLFPGRSRRGGKDGGAPITPPPRPPPPPPPPPRWERAGLGTQRVPCSANPRPGLAPPKRTESRSGELGAAGEGGGGGFPAEPLRLPRRPPRFTAPRSRGSGCRLPAGSAPRKPDAFAGFPDTPCKTGSQAIPRLQDL